MKNEPDNFYEYRQLKWGGEVTFPNTRSFEQYSHKIFNRYPARSIGLVPRSILSEIKGRKYSRQCHVLDPFMGSGTTAVEAALAGYPSYGVEIDPFARLLSEVKTTAISKSRCEKLRDIHSRVKSTWKTLEPDLELYPKLNNIEYWFDKKIFGQLLRLKTSIYKECDDPVDVGIFKVIFANMIRPCSLAERQTLKPYISKKYQKKPAIVEDEFDKSFHHHLDALEKFSQKTNKSSKVKFVSKDARAIVGKTKYDVAITSPPYINAIDYVRCIKLESAWTDLGDNELFKELQQNHVGRMSAKDCVSNEAFESIGSINALYKKLKLVDDKRANVVVAYFYDMYKNIACVFNCLNEGGEYHIIVGNSVIRDIEVKTHELLAEIASVIGFDWFHYHKYLIKDHRTSIPRNGNGGKIRYEHVISLRKSIN
jgi:DNA modification methylase